MCVCFLQLILKKKQPVNITGDIMNRIYKTTMPNIFIHSNPCIFSDIVTILVIIKKKKSNYCAKN